MEQASSPELIRGLLQDENVAALMGEERCKQLYDRYRELVGDEEASKITKPWEGSKTKWSWRHVGVSALFALGIMSFAGLIALLNRGPVEIGAVELAAIGGSVVFFAITYSVYQYSRHRKGLIWTRKVFGVLLWGLLLLVLLVFLIGGVLFMGLT